MVYAGMAVGQLERIAVYDPKKDEALEYVSKWIEQQRSIKDD
jgi:hypothetical protein